MKFIKASGTPDYLGIKVKLDDGKDKWLECANSPEHKTTAKQVHEYAKKAFKEGDEVEVETDGHYITRISKKGASQARKPTYNPAPKRTYEKPKDVQESIKRQSIGNMTSRTLIALQGQIDLNTILGDNSIIEAIYRKYQELVG